MIIYRDRSQPRPTAFRTPAWVQDSLVLARRREVDGDLLWHGEAFILPPLDGAVWHDLADGWSVTRVGELKTSDLVRPQPGLPVTPVHDGRGNVWLAPVVRDGNGRLQLSLGWGRDSEGRLQRKPEAWQQPLIHASDLALAELEAGRMQTADEVGALVEVVLPLLCAGQCLSPEVVLTLGLLDDTLAANLLRVAAGYAPLAV